MQRVVVTTFENRFIGPQLIQNREDPGRSAVLCKGRLFPIPGIDYELRKMQVL